MFNISLYIEFWLAAIITHVANFTKNISFIPCPVVYPPINQKNSSKLCFGVRIQNSESRRRIKISSKKFWLLTTVFCIPDTSQLCCGVVHWHMLFEGNLLGEKKCPIIIDPLVAAHPAGNRTCFLLHLFYYPHPAFIHNFPQISLKCYFSDSSGIAVGKDYFLKDATCYLFRWPIIQLVIVDKIPVKNDSCLNLILQDNCELL